MYRTNAIYKQQIATCVLLVCVATISSGSLINSVDDTKTKVTNTQPYKETAIEDLVKTETADKSAPPPLAEEQAISFDKERWHRAIVSSDKLFSEGDSYIGRLGKQVLTDIVDNADSKALALKLLPRQNVEAEFTYGRTYETLIKERTESIIAFGDRLGTQIKVEQNVKKKKSENSESDGDTKKES